jgi:hypothetical protein
MNFIERVFSVSPDGGSGILELLLIAIPTMAVGAVWYWKTRNLHRS